MHMTWKQIIQEIEYKSTEADDMENYLRSRDLWEDFEAFRESKNVPP